MRQVWSSLEASTPGLRRDEALSYGGMSAETCAGAVYSPLGGHFYRVVRRHEQPGHRGSGRRAPLHRYGLAADPAVFTAQLVRNRQDPRVIGAMTLLLDDEDVLMSQDRWCVYRPTRGLHPPGGESSASPPVDRPEWRTRGNLHLDLHPWNYMRRPVVEPSGGGGAGGAVEAELDFEHARDFPRELNQARGAGPHVRQRPLCLRATLRRTAPPLIWQVQGVLTLLDSRCVEAGGVEDGGTLLVPGFHAVFERWQQALGPVEGHLESHKGEGCNWLVARPGGGSSYKFSDSDAVHALSRRVPVREGSLLVWDQRLVHGSRPNDSSRPRMAQFVRGFRRASAHSAAAAARRRALIEREMRSAGTLELLTPLGRRVFGLS